MYQDELLGLMGEFGSFHKRLVGMLSLPIILNGFQTLMVIVTLAVPLHRCHLPGVENDTFTIQSQWHQHLVQSTIPSTVDPQGRLKYDKCHVYVNSSGYDVSNTSHAYVSVNVTTEEKPTTSCQSWVYDHSEFQSTVITQFNLVCDKMEFRAHINMAYMIGLFVGSPLAGFLCDTFGRRPILFAAVLVNAVVGVLSAYPFDPHVYLVYRMLNGAVAITIYLSAYVLLVEMVGTTRRNMVSGLVAVIWMVGPYLTSCLSYVLTDWTHIQICSGAPYIIFLLFWRFLPESPRWLLSKNRLSETIQVVRKAAEANGTIVPQGLEDEMTDISCTSEKEPPKSSQGLLQMFKYPRLIVRTLIIFLNWCVISMTYYGLSLNVANLGGSVRVNFLMSNTVELVGYISAWALLDRLGRKKTHFVSMVLAGLSCLATIFPALFLTHDMQWVTTVLAMIGKLGISAAFASIYLVSAELFPTLIRNFALGCSSTTGRIGSMMSPYIADLALYIEGSFGRALPLIIFGGAAVGAGLVSLLLPETLGRQLPDSIEEAAHFGTKRRQNTPDGTEMTITIDGKQAQHLMEHSEDQEKGEKLK